MTENTQSISPKTRLHYVAGVFYFAFRALVGAYAVSILISILIHFFLDESVSDIVGLINSTLYFMMIGTVILLPICLILRRKELVLMLLPSVIVWMVWTIPAYLPKSVPQAPPDASTITILTYNLLAINDNYADIIHLIREADADIVALQELNYDASDIIADQLQDIYPYMELHPAGIPGMGILSKYPLSDCTDWKISRQYQQRCLITITDKSIVFYNTHPSTPLTADGFRWRLRDLEAIFGRVNADIEAGETVIMAGDWNLTPLSDPYERITQQFSDAYAQVGQGIGFTYRLHNLGRIGLAGGVPIVRIDYVFYRAPVVALEARVWHENAESDHIPVWVKLALP
jgi:endonuclease/exonuclease/phosphatase (EEP) superfamily protein YafD